MAYSKAPKGWQQPWFDSMAGFRLTLGSVGCFINVEIIGKNEPGAAAGNLRHFTP